MADAYTTTPKRKRGIETSIAPVAFNFDLSRTVASSEDGGDSPRSRVVHTFRGLALGPDGDEDEDQGEQAKGDYHHGREGRHEDRHGGGGAAIPAAPAPAEAAAASGFAGGPDHSDVYYSSYSYHPAKKRFKPDQVMHEAPPPSDDAGVEEKERGEEELVEEQRKIPHIPLPEVVAEDPVSERPRSLLPVLPECDTDNGGLRRAYPSINRLSDSISRADKKKTKRRRRRSGTPPPSRRKKDGSGSPNSDREDGDGDNDDEEAMEIVDPVRAALTWREDEITIYDPEDEDDDGTGINGVGFRPTPALAHARVMKRRQQLAEYRKREEREARAKRSQRRRAGPGGLRSTPSPEQQQQKAQARRKVRFNDGDKLAFIATTS